jgi:mannose-6-phosphate isomerase-like protein (cupin superfamily)
MSSETQPKVDGRPTYQRYIEGEGVPIVEGLYIQDLKSVPVADWARTGVRGAIVRLRGAENLNDAYVLEIGPGQHTTPRHHMYEELIYVVQGRGATTISNRAGTTTSFEWGPGSVFCIPLNATYQHFNGSGSEPARYYAVTSAPLMMNLYHNQEFIFGSDFDFTDRFGGSRDDYSGSGTGYAGRIWDTNFIPDVHAMPLQSWRERGAGGSNVMLEIGESSMCGHISEFPVGTYKKAHRHRAGAHVIILGGQGFSLLWEEGQEIQQVDWAPGSVVVPPERWFHQHFNTGTGPARYLALRWGSKKYPVFRDWGIDKSVKLGGDQIEYEDEDPSVRATFEDALRDSGATSRMADVTGIVQTA